MSRTSLYMCVSRLTWIHWYQGFDSTMMECVWFDGTPVQIYKPDLQMVPRVMCQIEKAELYSLP